MIQNSKQRKDYRWENKLSFNSRQRIITLYKQGYAVFNIAKSYAVSVPTIEHHLMKAGIYVKNHEITKRNVPVPNDPYRKYTRGLTRPDSIFAKLPAHIRAIHERMLEEDERKDMYQERQEKIRQRKQSKRESIHLQPDHSLLPNWKESKTLYFLIITE